MACSPAARARQPPAPRAPFAKPANVLVLDEPTNDSTSSLELLEAATMQDYDGTCTSVSHDRAFLDNVVTQTSPPRAAESGRSTWAAGPTTPPAPCSCCPPDKGGKASASRERGVSKVKLSYKETRELASLPKEIEALEAEQQTLSAKMTAPDYYRQPAGQLRADQGRRAEIESLLIGKLERWEALEAKARTAAG